MGSPLTTFCRCRGCPQRPETQYKEPRGDPLGRSRPELKGKKNYRSRPSNRFGDGSFQFGVWRPSSSTPPPISLHLLEVITRVFPRSSRRGGLLHPPPLHRCRTPFRQVSPRKKRGRDERFSPADGSAHSVVYKTASKVLLKQIGPTSDQTLGFSKITGLAHPGHRVSAT